MAQVSVSLLNLKKEDYVHEFYNLETAKVDYFHIDVMDGKFVDNDTNERMKEYSNALSHISQLGLDVHLMVENVEEFIDDYLAYDPRIITFHIEAMKGDKERTFRNINTIKEEGARVGLAINPTTPIEEIKDYLPFIHMVLIMSVWPGKGGQSYITDVNKKILKLKEYTQSCDLDIDIEVDGGVNGETAKAAVEAGANILVAGVYIINNENQKEAVDFLKNINS